MLSTFPKSPLQPTRYYPWKDWHGSIKAAAFFPDGKRIVTAGHNDNSTRVWDLESGEEDGDPFYGHDHMSLTVAVSKSGKDIVTGGADNKVFLWKEDDRITSKVLFAGPLAPKSRIYSVAFSATAHPMLVASSGSDGVVSIWEVKSDAYSVPKTTIRIPGSTITSIQFSPANSSLIAVTCTSDKKIHIFDVYTGEQKLEMTGHTTHVCAFAWFPGGRRIASCGEKSIRIWDSRTGKESGAPLLGHERLVKALSISPDGKYIASGSNDGTVRVWNVATRAQLGTQIAVDGVSIVRFSPDGRSLLSVSDRQGVQLWPMEHLEVEEGLKFTREVVDDLMASSENFRVEMRNSLQEQFENLSLSHAEDIAGVKHLVDESATASYDRFNELQDSLNKIDTQGKEQSSSLTSDLKSIMDGQEKEFQTMKSALGKMGKKFEADITQLKETQERYAKKQNDQIDDLQADMTSLKKEIGAVQKALMEMNANLKKLATPAFGAKY